MNAGPAAPHALDAIQKTKTRVRILTGAGIIEGDQAHPAGIRLSEFLRNAASHEKYLLLTSVTVRQLDGVAAHDDLSHAEFILVNTAHAHAIIPLGE
jgi:hypothetical protein